jgi:hypothetical protein
MQLINSGSRLLHKHRKQLNPESKKIRSNNRIT